MSLVIRDSSSCDILQFSDVGAHQVKLSGSRWDTDSLFEWNAALQSVRGSSSVKCVEQ